MSAPLLPLPAEMVHPSHFEALFPALGPSAVNRLRGCARLSMRLSMRLAGRIGVSAALPSPGEPVGSERLALLSPERIDEAGRLMGAAWHGRALQSCISTEFVSEIDARLGRPARLFGLRNAALAVADAPPGSPGALVDAIVANGRACLVAWRDGLGEPYRHLADLKLPCRGLPAAAASDKAQPIIGHVVREMADAR